jgi:hypothetical protein
MQGSFGVADYRYRCCFFVARYVLIRYARKAMQYSRIMDKQKTFPI